MSEFIFILTAIFGLGWCIFIILLIVGLKRLKLLEGTASPTVSILVAARNEGLTIGSCLDALTRQNYPPELYEIIIIDDNSTDNTAQVVASYITKHPNIRLVQSGEPLNENHTHLKIDKQEQYYIEQVIKVNDESLSPKKRAILTGIMSSKGELILTTDADCIPPGGWVKSMANQFALNISAVVGYSPITKIRTDENRNNSGLESNSAPKFLSKLTLAVSRFDAFVNGIVSAGTIGIGIPTTATGRNFAYRRKYFWEVGGFGKQGVGVSGDDDLLLQRIASSKGKVIFSLDPNSFVPSLGQPTLFKWWQMKRRHLSAGKRYNTKMIITSSILYSFNLGLTICFILCLVGSFNWLNLLSLWLVKAFFDGLALKIGAIILREQSWRLCWLFGEFLSIFAITLLVPASLIGKIDWRGRKLKS